LSIAAVEAGAQDQREGETSQTAIVTRKPLRRFPLPILPSPPFPSRAAVRGKAQEEEGREGFVTGFIGRETAPARPSQESSAMTASSKVRNIALSQLVLSPANVRKTAATAAEDAALEASIRAEGILQNLIVHAPPVDGKGVYEVHAGGRRLKMLQKLAAEGVIDADHPVPCLVKKPAAAVETSLAENTIRAAMHPADEFVAMAALIDAGETVEAVATRFGVSEKHVKQRLRLGKLAPELLDEFRAGEISLEVVTAFTLGADHAAQLAVWRQVKDNSYMQPYTVKRLLTESAIPLDAGLGLFVGAEAYQAAGGTITRDLFSGDEDGFMDDAALVRRLAIEKLEAKATELRPQWAWTKAVLDPEYGSMAHYARVLPQPAEVSAPLVAEIERIEQRLGELENIGENDWSDELATETAQLEERRGEIDEIIDGLAVYSDKDRARAGCIVTIGDDGEFCIHQGLVDRSAARNGSAAASPEAEDDRDEASASPEFEDDEEIPRRPPLSSEQALRKECGFSQLLVDDLKAHRLQITRAHLAADFVVAFDLALYSLCIDLFERFGYRARPLDLRATETTLRSSLNDLTDTGADRSLATHRAVLELDWLQLPPAQGFAALAALPPEEKQRLFAWCIAATLKPQLAVEDRADPVIECAGRRLTVGFEDYWRPTAANYWGRVKKAHGLEIGRKVLGERWAREHADDKKPVLAAALEMAFDIQTNAAGVALGQAERDTAAAWLPPGIAYGAAENASADDPEHDSADPIDADGEPGEADLASTDLPAFFTDDQHAQALNGAAAD
jgi:ParB family transcriptional regulator, chromosome partitioning protein